MPYFGAVPGFLIYVQFCNGQFALIFVSDFIQNRANHLWTAPLCPEIDEDRPVRFEYIRVKTVVSQVNNFIAHITPQE